MVWYPVDESGECLRIGARGGQPYEDIPCLYPIYGKTYFGFEKISDVHMTIWDFMLNNTWLPYAACAIYFISIFLGQKYFENRPAWNWRGALAAWNLGLAVFSIWGFSRTAPQLVHNLYYYDWRDTLAEEPFSMIGMGATAHWLLLFILSKFVELFDTFFIVIHKKKLMFLHWYHHITVLLFCWHSWVNHQPMGIIFCVVNYAVHSVMYFYYFLMAVKSKPKWFNPQFITVAQISQMVVGVIVCYVGWGLVGPGSHVSRKIIIAGSLMYASYLALFLHFFINRYVVVSRSKKKQ